MVAEIIKQHLLLMIVSCSTFRTSSEILFGSVNSLNSLFLNYFCNPKRCSSLTSKLLLLLLLLVANQIIMEHSTKGIIIQSFTNINQTLLSVR